MPRKQNQATTAPAIVSKPISTSHAADSDKISFLDLPGELRNQIYYEVLPKTISQYCRTSRSSNNRTAALMATCRQVHDEAVDILCGNREFSARIDENSIDFCGRRTSIDHLSSDSFAALNQIRSLTLKVISLRLFDAPHVQDLVFAFLGDLRPGYKLSRLNVTVVVEEDARPPLSMFRAIHPGDFSKPHIVAFLSDPLRTIRDWPGKAPNVGFSLHFPGRTGPVWKTIEENVTALIQSNTSVPNYKVFQPYHAVLRKITPFLDGFIYRPRRHWSHPTNTTAQARIRGNIKAFKADHRAMVRKINALIGPKKSTGASTDEYSSLHQKLLKQAMADMLKELEQALPPDDADTSFFGYNQADDKLCEWRAHGCKEARVAKLERKRKREENKADKECKVAKKAKKGLKGSG